MTPARAFCAIALVCLAAAACSSRGSDNGAATSHGTEARQSETCLPGERGFLRASLRGAIDAELDWRGAGLRCEGGARPDNRGLRLSFLGPADAEGRRLRLVFGIAVPPGVNTRSVTPTNITVIVEGGNRLYATQGDDKCTVEALVQEPLLVEEPLVVPGGTAPAAISPATASRMYRVAARGYCIDPAATLDGSGRLYINRFDFAGQARFEDNEIHADAPHS